MVEKEKTGSREGKHRSAAVKVVTAFLASVIGLILSLVTMYLLSFLIGLLAEIMYSSGDVPAAVYKAGWITSYILAFSVLITSTVKIYGFLKKNLDFDFLP